MAKKRKPAWKRAYDQAKKMSKRIEEERQASKALAAALEREALSKQVFVRKLDYKTTADQIRDFFQGWGTIHYVDILSEAKTGIQENFPRSYVQPVQPAQRQSRGMAQVAFADAAGAKAVLGATSPPAGYLRANVGYKSFIFVKPAQPQRSRSHQHAGSTYILKLTGLQIGCLIPHSLNPQVSHSSNAPEHKTTLVSEVVVGAPSQRLELKVNLAKRRLQLYIWIDHPLLQDLSSVFGLDGDTGTLYRLDFRFKHILGHLHTTQCGSLMFTTRLPPAIFKAQRKDNILQRFSFRHTAVAGDDDEAYNWLRTTSFGDAYEDLGHALGRCMTYLCRLSEASKELLMTPEFMRSLQDFSVLPRWAMPKCFNYASFLPSIAVYETTQTQREKAQSWLDNQLSQLPYPLAWAVLCVLSVGSLHVWQLRADAAIAGGHSWPGVDILDEQPSLSSSDEEEVHEPGTHRTSQDCPSFFEILKSVPYKDAVQALEALRAKPLIRNPSKDLMELLEEGGDGAAPWRQQAQQRTYWNSPEQQHQAKKQLMSNDRYQDATGLIRVARIMITPTRILVLPSELELSNRVWREFMQPGSALDAFSLVRVTLGDENGARLFGGAAPDMMEDVFRRVEVQLKKGITLAGRHFQFLAYSSSQLKEQSVWMLASGPEEIKEVARIVKEATPKAGLFSRLSLRMPDKGRTAPDIIRDFWMGDIFKNIKVPAKAAARMGQCFSTTHKTIVLDDKNVARIHDVVRNGYTFTDGAGEISNGMLEKVLGSSMRARLRPHEAEGDISAIQIRFRGAKGVLSLNSSLEGCKIRLRPSQIKFEAGRGKAHQALEVVGLARPVPYYLNRHVILLLSNNGVPEDVFLCKQADMVRRLDAMMKDARAAEMVLPQLGGVNCLAMLRQMLKGGHSPQHEPLLRQCLLAVRTAALSELRAKARVLVTDGVCLIGAPDETGNLQEGCVFLQVRLPVEPGRSETYLHVITGKAVVAKHPVMHPGDVRIMEAVDLPELRHHRHELIFSIHGQRDDPNKMSGSDLDGDQYAVTWDPSLMPLKPNQEPMDYSASKPKEVEEVTPNHLIEHFIKFVKNDNLGVIANAWLAHADLARHEPPYQDIINVKECTKLAILHSTAVDFPKTGEPAELRKDLLPGKVPHWLERKDKEMYKSASVIGQLYDAVADEQQKVAKDQSSFQALLRAGNTGGPTLPALLNSEDIAKTSTWLQFAARLHAAYERSMLELMNRFGVYDEGEMLTGAIKKLNKFRKRKAHDTREAIVQEVQATASRVLRIFLAAILQQQQQQQQQQQPQLGHDTHHFDAACAALDGPYRDLSTDEMRRRLGWHHPALVGAAACAVYKVTYGELAGVDSKAAKSDSSDDSSNSDGGDGRSDHLLQKKREGGQNRLRLLGLPWIVAAEVLGA